MAPSRSPLEYDVSVSAEKRRRTRKRGFSGAFEARERTCDHPYCDAKAEYRAPRSPDQLEDYYWFCLDHVREYNSSWNFFANFTDDELEAQMRADVVWDRPTWRFGEAPLKLHGRHLTGEGRAWSRLGFDDPFEILGDNATMNPGAAPEIGAPRPLRRNLPVNERRALDILGAHDGMRRREIKTLFKSLVKGLHPDMNAGERRDEDRLREVVWAWEQIRGSRSFPE